MKKILLFAGLLLLGFIAQAQEFSSSEGFYIGQREVRPSLTMLSKDPFVGRFTLREVDFSKEQKREVDLVAMMEQVRYEQESSYIELDAPTPDVGKTEKSFIQITNEVRVHDRGSNFDLYTGEKKIPAYEEMRVPLFRSPYYSGSRIRAYASPYRYSNPYLR